MIHGQMIGQLYQQLMSALKPAAFADLIRQEPAQSRDDVKGLNLGEGFAKITMGDAVTGKQGQFIAGIGCGFDWGTCKSRTGTKGNKSCCQQGFYHFCFLSNFRMAGRFFRKSSTLWGDFQIILV